MLNKAQDRAEIENRILKIEKQHSKLGVCAKAKWAVSELLQWKTSSRKSPTDKTTSSENQVNNEYVEKIAAK